MTKELLGKILVHEIGGQRVSARIVEVEAYMGLIDKAAHSYGGKRTPRVEVMYGGPGYSPTLAATRHDRYEGGKPWTRVLAFRLSIKSIVRI